MQLNKDPGDKKNLILHKKRISGFVPDRLKSKIDFVYNTAMMKKKGFIAFYLALGLALLAAEIPEELKLDCQWDAEEIKTGHPCQCRLSITNQSEKLVVVTGISFPQNRRMTPIQYQHRVYGSISRDLSPGEDKYFFNGMAQRETELPFSYGVLLPGASREVTFSFTPMQRESSIQVSYVISKQKYDGTVSSQEPLKLYGLSPANQSTLQRTYLPATKEMLAPFKEIKSIPIGKHMATQGHHVLIPNLEQLPVRSVWYEFKAKEGFSMPLDEAEEHAARLMPSQPFHLHYSHLLKGYLVEPQTKSLPCWILTSLKQEKQGQPYPHDADCVLELLENPTACRLRIGDKQDQGISPDKRSANRRFWGKDVYYGDGMYTKGEFIEIEEHEWPDILRKTALHKGTITKVFYFFSDYYYKLTLFNSPAKDH